MRAVILGLVVFALGLASAAYVSPRAGAHAVDGTLSGSVGPGFSISMSASSVTPGNYTINVSDSATAHNFHFFGPGVDKKTSILGTGSTSWSVTLQAGTYTFQCDAHADSMNGSLTVADASTTTTATTSTTTPTTTTPRTTTSRTTTQRTTTEATTSQAETTAEATTTAATTTEAETTTTTAAATTTQSSAPPLHARVAAAHATATAVSITVTSNEHGRAVAQLFAGTRKVAEARGSVPGKLVLRPSHTLSAGRYVLKLRVTANGTTTTSRRVVTVP